MYAEGSEVCDALIKSCSIEDDDAVKAQNVEKSYGLSKPNHKEMIMNTEYSRLGFFIVFMFIINPYYYCTKFDMTRQYLFWVTYYKS